MRKHRHTTHDSTTFCVPVTIVGTATIVAKNAAEARELLNQTDLEVVFDQMNIDDTTYGRPVKMKD
jgi:hypothetical protein